MFKYFFIDNNGIKCKHCKKNMLGIVVVFKDILYFITWITSLKSWKGKYQYKNNFKYQN